MTSADFCRFSMTLRPWLPLSGRSLQTSPGTTRFFPSTYLPHLPSLVPCSYGTSTWVAALSSVIAYMRFLFVRPEVCQPASFRFRLAADTLAFGYTFPTTGQIPDFHRLETCAAGRTIEKTGPVMSPQLVPFRLSYLFFAASAICRAFAKSFGVIWQ